MVLAPLSVGLVLASGSVGHADAVGDQLTGTFTCTAGLSCTGPVGTVKDTVTSIGATETVKIEVTLAPGVGFANTGALGHEGIAFNITGGPTITYSGITLSLTGWSVPGGISPMQSPGSYGGDGVGNSMYALAWGGGPGGSDPGTSPLDFSITAAGLTLASLDSTLSDGTGLPSYFAADLNCLPTSQLI
jgi:hypothetical protein